MIAWRSKLAAIAFLLVGLPWCGSPSNRVLEPVESGPLKLSSRYFTIKPTQPLRANNDEVGLCMIAPGVRPSDWLGELKYGQEPIRVRLLLENGETIELKDYAVSNEICVVGHGPLRASVIEISVAAEPPIEVRDLIWTSTAK